MYKVRDVHIARSPDLEFLDFELAKKVKIPAKKYFFKKNIFFRGKLLGRDTSFGA